MKLWRLTVWHTVLVLLFSISATTVLAATSPTYQLYDETPNYGQRARSSSLTYWLNEQGLTWYMVPLQSATYGIFSGPPDTTQPASSSSSSSSTSSSSSSISSSAGPQVATPQVSTKCRGTNCTCGDGIVDAEEQCDDGNIFSGDGCSHECTIELTTYTRSSFGNSGIVLRTLPPRATYSSASFIPPTHSTSPRSNSSVQLPQVEPTIEPTTALTAAITEQLSLPEPESVNATAFIPNRAAALSSAVHVRVTPFSCSGVSTGVFVVQLLLFLLLYILSGWLGWRNASTLRQYKITSITPFLLLIVFAGILSPWPMVTSSTMGFGYVIGSLLQNKFYLQKHIKICPNHVYYKAISKGSLLLSAVVYFVSICIGSLLHCFDWNIFIEPVALYIVLLVLLFCGMVSTIMHSNCHTLKKSGIVHHTLSNK